MKKIFASMWFRITLCAILCLLCIVVPAIIAHTTRSNGLGAGMFAITLLFLLPISSLLCGCLSAPDPKKLWFLPALPTALYLLLFPVLTDGDLLYRLMQFSGLLIGYAAFALCVRSIRKRKH